MLPPYPRTAPEVHEGGPLEQPRDHQHSEEASRCCETLEVEGVQAGQLLDATVYGPGVKGVDGGRKLAGPVHRVGPQEPRGMHHRGNISDLCMSNIWLVERNAILSRWREDKIGES